MSDILDCSDFNDLRNETEWPGATEKAKALLSNVSVYLKEHGVEFQVGRVGFKPMTDSEPSSTPEVSAANVEIQGLQTPEPVLESATAKPSDSKDIEDVNHHEDSKSERANESISQTPEPLLDSVTAKPTDSTDVEDVNHSESESERATKSISTSEEDTASNVVPETSILQGREPILESTTSEAVSDEEPSTENGTASDEAQSGRLPEREPILESTTGDVLSNEETSDSEVPNLREQKVDEPAKDGNRQSSTWFSFVTNAFRRTNTSTEDTPDVAREEELQTGILNAPEPESALPETTTVENSGAESTLKEQPEREEGGSGVTATGSADEITSTIQTPEPVLESTTVEKSVSNEEKSDSVVADIHVPASTDDAKSV